MNSNSFIQIPPTFLEKIADNSDRIPRLYFSRNWFVRHTFWGRLYALNSLIASVGRDCKRALDFGGGSGVMLPTLAARFEQLVLVDLETRQAREVQQEYGLGNVEIVEDDIAALDFGSNPFDAIVAADVLEHFKDLALPVKTLRNSLKPGGLLFTSLPTENWVYRLLRRIFGITKPWDHYHTGYEVEDALKKNGFVRVRAKYIPLGIPLAPLFLVTAWKKGSDLVAP